MIRARNKEYYLKNKDILCQKMKERHIKNRDRHILTNKIGHYRRKFGITLEERTVLLSKGCQICGGTATQIDHCHKSGKIRGGLCNNCNTGLGMFNDSQERLINALQYISKN